MTVQHGVVLEQSQVPLTVSEQQVFSVEVHSPGPPPTSVQHFLPVPQPQVPPQPSLPLLQPSGQLGLH